jgi:hypothetical protein
MSRLYFVVARKLCNIGWKSPALEIRCGHATYSALEFLVKTQFHYSILANGFNTNHSSLNLRHRNDWPHRRVVSILSSAKLNGNFLHSVRLSLVIFLQLDM